MLLCPRCQPTIYKFFYFKIEIKTKVELTRTCHVKQWPTPQVTIVSRNHDRTAAVFESIL